MGGLDELEAIIDKVRLIEGAPEEIARLAAKRVEAVVRRTAAAGTTPEGEPWEPKKDGSRARANAASAVECRALGTVVQLRLIENDTGSQKAQALQEFGTKRLPARRALPKRGVRLPKNVVDALGAAANEFFVHWKKR